MKDFEVYNWWTLRAPMILCADSLHDDDASVWARDDDAEGHFKKQLFGPLQPKLKKKPTINSELIGLYDYMVQLICLS